MFTVKCKSPTVHKAPKQMLTSSKMQVLLYPSRNENTALYNYVTKLGIRFYLNEKTTTQYS